jgi:hypothetical protein
MFVNTVLYKVHHMKPVDVCLNIRLAACADGLCPRIAEIKCPSVADNIVHSIA